MLFLPDNVRIDSQAKLMESEGWTYAFGEMTSILYPGVYLFEAENELVLYVGMSKCLGSRLANSYLQRFGFSKIKIYCKVAITLSEIDANIAELFYINALAPLYNKKHKDGIRQISFENMPLFCDVRTLCRPAMLLYEGQRCISKDPSGDLVPDERLEYTFKIVLANRQREFQENANA